MAGQLSGSHLGFVCELVFGGEGRGRKGKAKEGNFILMLFKLK